MTVLPLRPITGSHAAPRVAPRSAAERGALARRAAPVPTLAERLERALGASYRVASRLGAGGYGEVFLVRDLHLHRVLAVKVLRESLAADPRERERFRREARTVAHLSHPGIVPVLAYGEADETSDAPLCWAMMPCAGGGSLAGRLARDGCLPAAETAAILVALCEALAHAHRRGVVHCDLKPDNVLFVAGGADDTQPLLTDFGIAARPHHDAGIGHGLDVGGTPAWMAPEQRLGLAALDARSDVYGLGMLGWVMLTGRLPERGMRGRMERDRVPEGVPAALLDVLDRAVAREPDARWDGAMAMADALARASRPAWLRRATALVDGVTGVVRRLRREVRQVRASAAF